MMMLISTVLIIAYVIQEDPDEAEKPTNGKPDESAHTPAVALESIPRKPSAMIFQGSRQRIQPELLMRPILP